LVDLAARAGGRGNTASMAESRTILAHRGLWRGLVVPGSSADAPLVPGHAHPAADLAFLFGLLTWSWWNGLAGAALSLMFLTTTAQRLTIT